MNSRSIILLCLTILLLFAFLFGVLQFDRDFSRRDQQLHATATAYVPTTTVPPTTQPTEPPVVMAPDFVITDAEGKTYGILNFKGKPTILCFWTTQAEEELNRMQELFDTYGDRIHLLMIHMTGAAENKETALAFLADKNYTFPVYFDTLETAVSAYKISISPTTYYMTKDQVLTARSKGSIDVTKLPTRLAEIGLTTVQE